MSARHAWSPEERRRRRSKRLRQLGKVGLIVAAVGVVTFGRSGTGPLGALLGPKDPPSTTAAATTTRAPSSTVAGGGTTTTNYAIEGRYQPGDCVRWDQTIDGATRGGEVVPCTEPHLIQILGTASAPAGIDHEPTPDEWSATFERECGPRAVEQLGGPVDPLGRYRVSGLYPTSEGWARGERVGQCGVQMVDYLGANGQALASFSGPVDLANQQALYRRGDCLTTEPTTVVPCTSPHVMEMVGDVDLTGRIADVPDPLDASFWQTVLGDECTRQAVVYLGRTPTPEQKMRWFTPAQSSWRLGSHVAQCALSVRTGDTMTTLTSPLGGTGGKG